MVQPFGIGKINSLAGYVPLMAAATLCGISLFVLSRNRKAAVNRLFAAGAKGDSDRRKIYDN